MLVVDDAVEPPQASAEELLTQQQQQALAAAREAEQQANTAAIYAYLGGVDPLPDLGHHSFQKASTMLRPLVEYANNRPPEPYTVKRFDWSDPLTARAFGGLTASAAGDEQRRKRKRVAEPAVPVQAPQPVPAAAAGMQG
eukprot:TRINITY_DN20683_c0_g1_i1.p1 TRINITY_DN20683_c0_g1~~TRINITY_DN20683_c0_g1_i1.p1  ORF type:complete len:149 (+),score=37.36 TRINITY_DN20683_c0_g1_i1:29-448(+)